MSPQESEDLLSLLVAISAITLSLLLPLLLAVTSLILGICVILEGKMHRRASGKVLLAIAFTLLFLNAMSAASPNGRLRQDNYINCRAC